ncbi:MAG: hypothetical protein KKA84_02740 [Bacteroidetes bacterium]|nr:hypothetical protein [Bacteroidota bacterium]
MKKKIEHITFVLLIVGTVGLLMNEFFLEWGMSGTFLFAVFNVAGLVGFWFLFLDQKQ